MSHEPQVARWATGCDRESSNVANSIYEKNLRMISLNIQHIGESALLAYRANLKRRLNAASSDRVSLQNHELTSLAMGWVSETPEYGKLLQ